MKFEEAKKLIEELDSGFMSCNMDYEGGFSDAKDRVLEILDEIDTEPVGNPDKLTLTELAKKLREIFEFRYLTVSQYCEEVLLWWDKPESDGFYWWATETCTQVAFYSNVLSVPLDLSEYKDENGKIDYSKCIVEVG